MRFWEKPPSTDFEVAVHRVIGAVPRGRVVTYGDVARAAGHPRAGRAVGTVMRLTPSFLSTPCHRVVRSDGTVGEYGAGVGDRARKVRLLRHEGIHVDGRGRIVDFKKVRWRTG